MEPTAPARSHRTWLRTLMIWTGVGLFQATQTVVSMRAMGMRHAWLELFVFLWLSWLPWALVTPLAMRLARRWPLWPLRAAACWRHALALLGSSLAATLWSATLEHALNPWNPLRPPVPVATLFSGKAADELLSSLFIYYCILAAGFMLDSRERLAREREAAAELAGQLAQAQLVALRHQVEPHFLFNALNAVSGLVREGHNERALETIARMSEFLRHSLHGSNEQQAPLAEELQLARLYLEIQQLRFGERLRVDIAVAPALLHTLVPRLILQPLVENAVKHGLARRAQPGVIEIAARAEDDRVVLTVYNDGPALPPPAQGGAPTIGLRNVRGRLAGLHGDAASLTLADVAQRGVLATLVLPWRQARPGAVAGGAAGGTPA